MAGPTKYWKSMNSPVPITAKIRDTLRKKNMADKNNANMKAAMNIEVPIANFRSDSLAKRDSTLAVSEEKQIPN